MSVVTHEPPRGLLPVVFKLLALRWRINLNSFKHAKTRTKVFTIVGIVAVLAFAGFIFWLSWMLLGYVSSPKLVIYTGINAGPLMDAMPVTIFTGMFIGILLTSFGVLLQALYLSGDMDFLLAAPVPIRAVFITKLLQAVLPNFGFMALFGLPLLYGMGAARGYNFFFYPLVPIVMVALTLAAAGLSSLLVMLVVRAFPPRRIAEVLGFATATISILCSQSGNLLNFRRGGDVSPNQINQLVELQSRLNNPWFPLNWAGRGLVELGSGNWLTGILLVALTLTLLSGAFWFALVTAERWYYTGWAGMQGMARKKRAVSAPPPLAVPRGTGFSLLGRLLPAPTRGILQKDFVVLRRDLRNLSHLVTPLIFGIIYATAFMRNGPPSSPSSGAGAVFTSVFSYANIGIALFAGWNLLTRLGGMAFSLEGKNYWMLKAAPLRASHLLTAKFLMAYLPALTIGIIFMVVVSIIQHISIVSFLYSTLVTALCLAEMAGISVAFGAAGANLNWDDPRKMTSGTFGCLGIIATMIGTAITFLLFIGPLLLVSFLHLPEALGYLSGLLFGGVFSIGCALIPLWLVRKKVERLGEE